MTATAGQTSKAAVYNVDIRKLIAYGQRLSNSTTTTSEGGVLRLDDIPILAGHRYLIETSTLLIASNAANDVAGARIRYTTDGSTPSTSSTLLTQVGARVENTSTGDYGTVKGTYSPASDETLSILLTACRISGSGSCGINYGGSVPIELLVWDCGIDPGDTGTDI